jgi:hypothetical protein
MTPFRPFKLLNSSERARIAEVVTNALGEWRQTWVAPPAARFERPGQRAVKHGDARTERVVCDDAAAHDELHQRGDWLSFAASRGTLYVADAGGAMGTIRSLIAAGAGDTVASEDSVAAELLRTSLRALVEPLMNVAAVASDTAPPPALWLRGSGAAWVSLPLGDVGISVLLDSGLVRELVAPLPRPVRTFAPLANPQHCIGHQPVEIRVWLGSTDIELSTLQTLSVNDVLLLDSRIDHPLRITVNGKEAPPRAVLGSAEQHKAIRLTTYSAIH